MKTATRMRISSLVALGIFCCSFFYTSISYKELSIDTTVSAFCLGLNSPANGITEEIEDVVDSDEDKHSIGGRLPVSNSLVSISVFIDYRQVVKLTFVTYCVGQSLYLAHRAVLI
jgi:hypothetical protein